MLMYKKRVYMQCTLKHHLFGECSSQNDICTCINCGYKIFLMLNLRILHQRSLINNRATKVFIDQDLSKGVGY